MNDLTINENIAGDVLYRIYTQAFDQANHYIHIVAEFTVHPACHGCLTNAIMSLLHREDDVNTNTVLAEYQAIAANHIGKSEVH